MMASMWNFVRSIHNKRPILLSVIAFIVVVVTATALTVWWNVLLVQNHRILIQMTAAAKDPSKANLPLALMMIIGLLCSVVIVLGIVYMFLRLIRSVQLNLAQSQFIAAVTHELKSPVAALQIMFETIRDPSTPAEKRREFEQYMENDLRRLRLLVEQVLDTARLEHLTADKGTDDVDVAELLSSCTGFMETRLKTTGSQIRLAGDISGTFVRGNRRLLMTAFANIFDNAVKYSRGPATIDVRVDRTQKWVAIEVHDNGIGIPRKEQKKIFRRFYRAPDATLQAKPGTGLGLYFARLAVRSQGGNLSVSSAGPGQGSTFKVELPPA